MQPNVTYALELNCFVLFWCVCVCLCLHMCVCIFNTGKEARNGTSYEVYPKMLIKILQENSNMFI